MKRDLNWLKAKADIRIGCFDMVSMGYAIEMYNEDQAHIEKLEKEIASLKELVVQAILLIETDKSDYSLKNVWVYNKHEWLKKVEHYIKMVTQARREK